MDVAAKRRTALVMSGKCLNVKKPPLRDLRLPATRPSFMKPHPFGRVPPDEFLQPVVAEGQEFLNLIVTA
jgi:hypothetical protein